MVDIKRNRGKNFLDQEKETIIDLIAPHKSIIENIKTDNATNKEKEKIWEQIAESYNALQTTGVRTINQLKHVYDNLKRVTRKVKSDKNVKAYMDFHKQCLINSFTPNEKDVLIDIMMPYKDTLENEKNAEISKIIWQDVCDTYNSQTTKPKTVKEICNVYEIIKSEAISNRNAEKKSIYKTGGGRGECSIQSTPGQSKILGFLGDRMEPLENNIDSDAEYRELTKCCKRNDKETPFISLDDSVDVVEVGLDIGYDAFDSSHQLDTDGSSKPVISGCIRSYDNEIKQNSSNEKSSTKRKKKFCEPVAVPKSTAANVLDGLNELVGKRSSIKDIISEYKNKLYDLQIQRAKIELETALIEKEVAEKNLLSSISVEKQNNYKEEILKLELNKLLEK